MQGVKREPIEQMLEYIIENVRAPDRLKLMKLSFLVKHYDPSAKKLTKNGFLGVDMDFVIYSYGVFSFEVYRKLLSLISSEKVEEKNRVLSVKEASVVDDTLKQRIDRIISEFGDLDGWELASKTLNMLSIEESHKREYLGSTVKSIIKS